MYGPPRTEGPSRERGHRRHTHPRHERGRQRDLSPGFRRLTFAGGLERYRSAGPDSFVYVLLPPPGRRELTIGTDFTWTACFAMPDDERPVGAYYTVRSHRPEARAGELDVDVVLHDHAGPASAWAATARSGDPVGAVGSPHHLPPPGRHRAAAPRGRRHRAPGGL